jgi:hypothetical protein
VNRHEFIDVKMPDGSMVRVHALLAEPGVPLNERDIEAIRACVHAISERRLDPQRATRIARRERREGKLRDEDDV